MMFETINSTLMKLILSVLFYTFAIVQTKVTSPSVNDGGFVEEGSPVTIECNKPSGRWEIRDWRSAHFTFLSRCENCSLSSSSLSRCEVPTKFRNRMTLFCSEEKSILQFNSTRVEDSLSIRCPENDNTKYFHFKVGRYDGRLHPENNSLSLIQRDFTLIYDRKKQNKMVMWLNERGEPFAAFRPDCSVSYEFSDNKKNGFTFICSENESRLRINEVKLRDNNRLFICGDSWFSFSLYRMRVKDTRTSPYPTDLGMRTYPESTHLDIRIYPYSTDLDIRTSPNLTVLDIKNFSDTFPNTTIPTDSILGIFLPWWVIAVLGIIIIVIFCGIIAGIVCRKWERAYVRPVPSKYGQQRRIYTRQNKLDIKKTKNAYNVPSEGKNKKSIPLKELQLTEGPELIEESIYDTIDDVSNGSDEGGYEILEPLPLTGQEDRIQHVYLEIFDTRPIEMSSPSVATKFSEYSWR